MLFFNLINMAIVLCSLTQGEAHVHGKIISKGCLTEISSLRECLLFLKIKTGTKFYKRFSLESMAEMKGGAIFYFIFS